MLQRILLPLAVLLTLVVAVTFAALNPGTITVDLGFFESRLQKSLALTLAFGAGWLFGLVCLAFVLVRIALDRRRLRQALKLAESEIHVLRRLPSPHAD